jgi:RNA-directed DNA polymerase
MESEGPPVLIVEVLTLTTIAQNHWRFGASDGLVLAQHVRTTTRRHVKVRGVASPFDGNLPYWSQRLRNHPMLQRRLAVLLHRQQGRCPACSLFFRDTDRLEVANIVPQAPGGTSDHVNLQVLYRHCHDQKQERSMPNADCASRGVYDKNCASEEPDAVNNRTSSFQAERRSRPAAQATV